MQLPCSVTGQLTITSVSYLYSVRLMPFDTNAECHLRAPPSQMEMRVSMPGCSCCIGCLSQYLHSPQAQV